MRRLVDHPHATLTIVRTDADAMDADLPVRSCEQVVPLVPGLDHLAVAIDDEDDVPVDPGLALCGLIPIDTA